MTTGGGGPSETLIPPPPVAVGTTLPGPSVHWWGAWLLLGVWCQASGLSPTGGRLTDAVMVTVAAALAARAAWRTPPWLAVTVAGVFGAFALGEWIVTALAVAAAAAGTALEFLGRSSRATTATLTAAVIALATALPTVGGYGTSAAVGIGGVIALTIGGLARESSSVRRRYLYGGIFTAELAAILTGLALYGLVRVRNDLGLIKDQVRNAVDSFSITEPETAREQLEAAAAAVDEIGERVNPLTLRGAELVPIVAQHVRAARVLTTETGPALDSVARATSVLRADRLTITDGRVDLASLTEMGRAADEVASRLSPLRRAVDDAMDGFLLGRLRDPLEQLQPDLQHADRLATGMADLFDQAPHLLGDDAPRRYLIAFVTPSEARGLGGFMANYAVVETDDGQLELAGFGRSSELLEAARAREDTLSLSGPASYLERYQRYGVGGDGAPTPRMWWQQITVSPDMPSVGTAIADMYRQSTDVVIDGVIVIDPAGIEALVSATGPVDPGGDLDPVGVDNIREYLLRGQYDAFADKLTEQRTDALETVARTTVDRLLDLGAFPVDTLRRLGDAFAERHLLVWAADPSVQAALERMGASGSFELEAGPSTHAIQVVNQNGGPNKLDAFLQRTIDYEGVLGADGVLRATVTVTLENTVPSLDLRPEVIANGYGEPLGTNRSVVTFYSSGAIRTARLDAGDAATLATGRELGWAFWEQLVLVPPFRSSVLEFTTEARIADTDELQVELHAQPVANPDQYSVKVTTHDGRVLIDRVGTLSRLTRLNLDQS